MRRELPFQSGLRKFHGERNLTIGSRRLFSKGSHSSALAAYFEHIQVCVENSCGETGRLCQQCSVLRNQIMPSEYQILGGFSFSGGSVNISAQKSCAGGFYQKFTVSVLGYRLIGCRQIGDHRSPCQCMGSGWRIRHPQVLADLTAKNQLRQFLTAKQKIRSKRDLISSQTEVRYPFLPGSKISALVKFRIRRNVFLRDHSQNTSTIYCGSHVIQTTVLFHGKSHKKQCFQPACLFCDRKQCLFCLLQQKILQKKIITGIPGNAQFGEHYYLCSVFCRFFCLGTDCPGIIDRIRHPDPRCSGRNFDKSLFHKLPHFTESITGSSVLIHPR